jgi:hypothetical protein
MEVIASSVNASFSLHCCHSSTVPATSIPQVLYHFIPFIFSSASPLIHPHILFDSQVKKNKFERYSLFIMFDKTI